MCSHKVVAANSTHVVCKQCTSHPALESTKNARDGNRPHVEANRRSLSTILVSCPMYVVEAKEA